MSAKASQRAERPRQQLLERRTKARQAAGGEVVFFFADPDAVEVHGTLLDVSLDGFRAAHPNTALRAGQEVAFRHPLARGSAQVIWNRVLGDRVETGFRVLEKTS